MIFTINATNKSIYNPVNQRINIIQTILNQHFNKPIKSLTLHLQFRKGPVAQLDRASDYGSEGLGFESLRVRQY